jgi:omega-6 fatty acid desaturase (delta-12 desaturase)
MTETTDTTSNMAARDWVQVLKKYREPNSLRSSFELGVSVVPFIALWVLACWIANYSYIAALGISAVNGCFLLRLFCIQHDCGHGSFFGNRTLSDWTGRTLGILTLTPYDVWRRTHSIHHSHAGDLDQRGIGDVMTLTVEEYHQRSRFGQLLYRAYRHPVVMFGIGPTYLFFLTNRIPWSGLKQTKDWISAMGTNLAIAVLLTIIVKLGGWQALFLVFLPTTLIAATTGVWLFYVQHQFETTHWVENQDWQVHEAALHGSSHYDLPPILQWFSANIGIHHVHHLYSRIPFYRLTEVLRDHEELANSSSRMNIRQSFKCAGLNLWDSTNKRLVSFATARKLQLG